MRTIHRSHEATAPRGQTSAPILVPLENAGSIEVRQRDASCQLRITAPHRAQALEIEVRFDKHGPVVRVSAPTIEMNAVKNIAVDCETFEVRARETLRLQSKGDLLQSAERKACVRARDVEIDANPGAIRLRANDDVQLLGENVLLNCERPKPLPEWTQAHLPFSMPSLAPRSYDGDPQLVNEMLEHGETESR